MSETRTAADILKLALADRDARPWRYYKFERDDLEKWLEKVANERDTLIAALRSFPAGETWRPIASAPKDGRQVLLWWPYWTKRPTIGYWKHTRWIAEASLSEADTDPTPTHWMPLPTPPVPADTEERR